MTHIRSLALVACLALLCLSYSASTKAQDLVAGQTYTTGNVVLPTNQGGPTPWVNGVYQDNLTCWAWGNPGYCGPNAIVRPGNNINFSFGLTDLHQIQAIANILPNTGTGLRVDGYNFGFTAKNGNGWDDGQVDTLSAYVQFTNPSNQIVESKSYNLNYKFNWTTFNYSETFATPYASKDLGNVRYGFIGRDNNYWAGPYGPEVTNVNFSLKYSVDPCASNVLSSPSCPGYYDTISSYSTQPTTSTVEPVATQTTTSTTPTVVTTSTTPIVETTQTITPSTSSQTTSITPTTVVVTTTTTTVTPSATNPQPKVGEVSIAGSQPSTSKSTVSTSQILSIIGSEQSRLSRLEMNTAAAAVEQAKQDSAKVTSDAQSIAATQQAQTLASSQQLVNSLPTGGPQSLGTGLQMSGMQSFTGLPTNASFGVGGASPQGSLGLSVAMLQQMSSTNGIEGMSTAKRTDQETIKQQFEIRDVGKQVTNITDPVHNIINPPVAIPTPPPAPAGPAVNRDAQPNEAAGGRDINSIAVVPIGFNAYSQLILRDAAFYKPYEVYKNQVNVDNMRALRQLSSDRLHQEMVNQQYKNNN